MTSRRTFVKTLAAIPPALAFRRSMAVTDPSRLALVIGNSAYRMAPLLNPANDARNMAALLSQAGFAVSPHFDAPRTSLIQAIDELGKSLLRPEVKQVFFYYAGHGAQLDWRNYLVPVDANISSAEQMIGGCVDLNHLLERFKQATGKTFVIILDACRDDPFGGTFRPASKGLSQFDAPTNCLLAYATSPGRVASDGSGSNGLYTEHLLREFAVREVKLEDALKRVRLNVRLASRGAQIPWESTSLEDDVFMFPQVKKKLSESEIEKLLEAETGEWLRIRGSGKTEDLVGYLRAYPNGKYAEIAQMRLARLLAVTEQAAVQSVQLAPSKPEPSKSEPSRPEPIKAEPIKPVQAQPAQAATSQAADSSRPYIELRPGLPIPKLFEPSANPYSSGRYPLGRKFTVGDDVTSAAYDYFTKVKTREWQMSITSVDEAKDRVEANDGQWTFDLMGNTQDDPFFGKRDVPTQIFPAELQVGKKWTGTWKITKGQYTSLIDLEYQIRRLELVRIALGEFHAFLIEGSGWSTGLVGWTGSEKLERRYWVVPGINFAIKSEILNRNMAWGRWTVASVNEITSLRQQGVDSACRPGTTTRSRNLVITSTCA